MAIANKFIHFNTKAGFLTKISEYVTYTESTNTYTVKEGKTDDWNMFKNYTCFIKDTQQIWTHEQFYNCTDETNLEAATVAPKVAGTAAVGTSVKYAREDHVHPLQTSVSGNAGTATKLASARTISLTGDATGSASFDGSANVSINTSVADNSHNHGKSTTTGIYESRVVWADSSTTPEKTGNNLSPIDAILIPELGANRFAGITSGVTYEYSRDGGTTWTAYSDEQTTNITKFIFSQMRGYGSGSRLLVGNYTDADAGTLTSTTAWQTRVTINFNQAGVYSQIRKFAIYMSSNYSQNCTVSIEGATLSAPDTFEAMATDVPISGWSGWDTINVPVFTTSTMASHTSYIRYLRLIFKFNGISDPTQNQVCNIHYIAAYGGVGWYTASNVSKNGVPYTIVDSTVEFPAHSIKSARHITSGGTNSQVVLGDGTLKSLTSLDGVKRLTIASGYDDKLILDNTDDEGSVSYISFRKNGTQVATLGINITTDDSLRINGNKIWHMGNDGSGSGLDADTLDGKHLSEITSGITLSADKITSGTLAAERLPEIPIEKIPAAALERLFVVASETAAMSADVQEGDVVQVTGNSNKMYFCISSTATTFANKFKEFTAGTAASVPWSGVTSKPSWIGTTKPTYDGSEINLTNYTKATADATILATNTINQAIGILDKRSGNGIEAITDESGISVSNQAKTADIELISGDVYSIYESKGIIDTYTGQVIPANMQGGARSIEGSDQLLVYTTDGEIEPGPSFTEDSTKFLDAAGAFTTPPDTKDYPTSLTWTNGTTAGPVGKLAGTNMTTVSFPAIPSASSTISGVVTTGTQTFAGNKTFSGTVSANVINGANTHSWMTACNYGSGVINMNQTTEGLNSAVVFQTNTDSHFTLSATGNYLMLGGYKGDERTYTSNTLNGHDGGIGIIIDDNSAVIDDRSLNKAKWRFYGYSKDPQGNITWSIDQDGQFTGTSRYTKNYALSHKTVSSTSTIEAGNSYYVSATAPFTVSTLSGFSDSTPDAQIVTSVKVTFSASNAMKIQGLDDITGATWYIYNLTYMPNGKVAISGAGFTN